MLLGSMCYLVVCATWKHVLLGSMCVNADVHPSPHQKL